jgi:hypothetical protein
MMLQAAIRSVLAEQDFKRQHALLRVRLDALQKAAATQVEPVAPPLLAELFISFLVPKNSAQAQLGDLQEMFQKNAARYGERRARREYWMEVARSLGPLLLQWLKRVGFFTILIDYFRSKFGL